jgi:class II lanthipeptide synthase
MRTHEDSVRRALSAAEVVSPSTYTWCGRLLGGPPTHTAPGEAGEVRAQLLTDLTQTLYTSFYCVGAVAPLSDPRGEPSPRATPFAEALSDANRGSGSWEDGWRLDRVDGERLVVQRGGLDVWARAADVVVPGDTARTVGVGVRVRLPKELRLISPGFYTALGDRALKDAGPILRFYWHLREGAAAAFMHSATSAFNAAELAFRLKVLNAPGRFTRCDAGVLYVAGMDHRKAMPLIADLHSAFRHGLKSRTPVFAKRLAAGLAVAEDPGCGESFGVNRCRHLADGIIRAHERDDRELHARMRVVRQTFGDAGIALETPYLNPGSEDVYRLELVGATATAPPSR